MLSLPSLVRAVVAVALASAFFAASPSIAQMPTIEVASVSPLAIQIGTKTELKFSGSRTDELSHAVLFAGRAGQLASNADLGILAEPRIAGKRLLSDVPLMSNSFDIQVADTATPGLVEVQAVGRFGISNPRRMLLTRKAIVSPAPGHHNPGVAVVLPSDSIVTDTCTPQQRNYYAVAITAGTTLHTTAFAQPLDSRASLLVTLLDRDGSELAQGRSIENWPAEFAYTADRDREVYVVVHDLLFQGGAEYPYLLEVATAGDKLPAELNTSLRPSIPSAASELAERIESTLDVVHPLTAPFTGVGTLDQGESFVDFTAAANQQLEFHVRSQELGGLTDPSLIIYKLSLGSDAAAPPVLTQLAQLEDLGTIGRADVRWRRLDPSLVWSAPEEANYRVRIVDQQAGKRPSDSLQFVLTVKPVVPSFRLLTFVPFPSNNPAAARNFGCNLTRGGCESLHVLVTREGGYQGPIEVSVDGLPPGLICYPAMIPAGAQEGDVIIASSDDAPAWHGPLHVVGRAPLHGTEQAWASVPSQYAAIRWGATGTRNAVQHRELAELWLSNNDRDVAPLHIQFGGDPLLEVARGAKLNVPIQLMRRAGAQAECTLRPQSLPPGVALGEIKIAADASEATAEMTIAGDAPLGEFTLWLQVETKLKQRPNPQSLEREEAYLTALQAALAAATSDEEKAKWNEAITAATTKIEELKQQTAEQEFTVWLPSTAQKVRIPPPSN